MPGYVGAILFFTLFFGVAAFIFIASGRQRKLWLARPVVLRSLASRRGYQLVENPGKPSELTPIRPVEKKGNVQELEVLAAVRGRTVDSQFTLFDVYTGIRHPGSRGSYEQKYETFLTIKSGEQRWPHFEFAAVSHTVPGSMTGTLLAIAANLGDMLMKDRGLTHVPIPENPGFQLYVQDPATSQTLRDSLVRLFQKREGWWIGALDDAMTFSKKGSRSASMATLVPEQELDRFIDEAVEMERSLRSAIRP